MNFQQELILLRLQLNKLKEQQDGFKIEIGNLERLIARIEKRLQAEESLPLEKVESDASPKVNSNPVNETTVIATLPNQEHKSFPKVNPEVVYPPKGFLRQKEKSNFDLENFIGSNLISKIGILVLVIGIIIGSKYAIDNNLISPITRIVFGYLIGGGLLAIAIKLKPKYETYSAVLLSGAMTALYFLTYAAYNYYNLFNTMVAFGLMLIFTIFTVLAALKYQKEIIAILGLVGAYGLPLLVGKDTGSPIILMTYVFIINLGVYFLFIKYNWKGMSILSCLCTWAIFLGWQLTHSFFTQNSILLIFVVLFYFQFYIALYIKHANTKMNVQTTVLLFIHTIIYTILGLILSHDISNSDLRWLFLLISAIVFAFTAFKYNKRDQDLYNFELLQFLACAYIALIAPVVFNLGIVTIYWATQALIMLKLGLKYKLKILTYLALALYVISGISLMDDWQSYQQLYDKNSSVYIGFNNIALTSVAFVSILGFQYFLLRAKSELDQKLNLKPVFAAAFIVTLFVAGFLDIIFYYSNITDSLIKSPTNLGNEYLIQNYGDHYNTCIMFIYSLVYVILVNGLLHWKKVSFNYWKDIIYAINLVSIFVFLLTGLFSISELRDYYLSQEANLSLVKSPIWIVYRYLLIACVISILVFNNIWSKTYSNNKVFRETNDVFFYLVVIWILSSELIQWLTIAGFEQTYKLGLSILWGLAALFLIFRGIFRGKMHLRYLAFFLFGITLIKLFIYDLSRLNTISKTIIFIILGIILLIVSYLYNRFKHLINPEQNKDMSI